MKQSVAELHATYPYNPDENSWRGTISFESAAAMAGDLHLQEDPVTYLDDLKVQDSEKASAIRDSLLYLPPKVLIDEIGVDVAAWTSVSTVVMGMNEKLNDELERTAGYNLDDLEAARSWEWRQYFRSLGRPILTHYNLMQRMRGDLLDNIDLPEILHESVKDGVELSNARINDYALIPLETESYSTYYSGGRVKDWSGDATETTAYHLWLDAPSGFALTYKGLPNAMGGIAMYGTDELMMHQLQGVQGKKVDPSKSPYDHSRYTGIVKARGLAPFDWQKIMTSVTEQLADTLDLDYAGLQSGKNNVWTEKRMPNDTEPHLPIETAEKIYDGAAMRLGYTRRDDDVRGNWHKATDR